MGVAVGALCRGAERVERGRESGGGERREEEGKADKQVPLVSCPRRKMRGHDGVRPAGWAGPWPVGCEAALVGEKRKEGVGWAIRKWAGGLCVCWVSAHGG
jgi:hypothetical protein